MRCPLCDFDNEPSAVRCARCSTKLRSVYRAVDPIALYLLALCGFLTIVFGALQARTSGGYGIALALSLMGMVFAGTLAARPPWYALGVCGIVAFLGMALFNLTDGCGRGQIRARVATVQAEQRNIAVALDSFHDFEGRYPTVREFYDGSHLAHAIPADVPAATMTLTTPIMHMEVMPGDPFGKPPREYHYYYFSDGKTGWILGSVGPDRNVDFFSGPEGDFKNERAFIYGIPGVASPCSPKFFNPANRGGAPGMIDCIYDPTNGVVSRGDVIKTGP